LYNLNEKDEENKLSNLFKSPSQIMFNGTLDAARNEAKNSKKFLLVTVVDTGEFSCLALNRDLWADQGNHLENSSEARVIRNKK
jgi:hypothetical protein